jgi:hypothetical protein
MEYGVGSLEYYKWYDTSSPTWSCSHCPLSEIGGLVDVLFTGRVELFGTIEITLAPSSSDLPDRDYILARITSSIFP